MAKRKEPLLQALETGESYTWTIPDGGNLASMRKAVKHGQTITMSPIEDPTEIQVGDIVYVKWHQGYLFHLVGQIQNTLGAGLGWSSLSQAFSVHALACFITNLFHLSLLYVTGVRSAETFPNTTIISNSQYQQDPVTYPMLFWLSSSSLSQ